MIISMTTVETTRLIASILNSMIISMTTVETTKLIGSIAD